MKFNLGCGAQKMDGFVGVDKYDKTAAISADLADFCEYEGEVEEITMFQVLEHIPYNQTRKVLENSFKMLRPGGKLTIEVPDLEYVFEKILSGDDDMKWLYNIWGEYYRPWDKDRYEDWEFNANSIHYTGFTFNRLRRLLYETGFSVVIKNDTEDKHPDYRFPENLSVTAIK